MKNLIFAFSVLLSPTLILGQSAKEIKEHAVKSADAVNLNVKKGKVVYSREISRYDVAGNLIEKIEYGADSAISKHEVMKYNANNQVIEEKKLNAKGELKTTTVFEYDNYDNCIKERVLGKEDKLLGTVEMKYDAGNHKIEESKYDPNHKLIKKVVCEYDEKGMMTAKKIFNAAGESMGSKTVKYEY